MLNDDYIQTDEKNKTKNIHSTCMLQMKVRERGGEREREGERERGREREGERERWAGVGCGFISRRSGGS